MYFFSYLYHLPYPGSLLKPAKDPTLYENLASPSFFYFPFKEVVGKIIETTLHVIIDHILNRLNKYRKEGAEGS